MASKHVITDAWFQINSVDLSDAVRSVEVNLTAADVEATTMGAAGTERIQGLRDDSFSVTLTQSFASSEVDQTIWPLFDGGSTILVEVAGRGTAISSTNPKFSGTVIITNYPPVSGAPGDLAETTLELPVSGKVTRATA